MPPFPVIRDRKYGVDCLGVELPVEVVGGPRRSPRLPFVLDTGCEITTVSEDVQHPARRPVLLGLGLLRVADPLAVEGLSPDPSERLRDPGVDQLVRHRRPPGRLVGRAPPTVAIGRNSLSGTSGNGTNPNGR